MACSSCRCLQTSYLTFDLVCSSFLQKPGVATELQVMTQHLDMQAGGFQEGCRVAATPAQPPLSAQQLAGLILPVSQPHWQNGQGQMASPGQVSSLSQSALSMSAQTWT